MFTLIQQRDRTNTLDLGSIVVVITIVVVVIIKVLVIIFLR